MKQYITTVSILLACILSGYSQGNLQYFANAGFKIKCDCQLTVNNTFIQLAKQQGQNNILAAYVCAQNEDNAGYASIININVYDLSASYSQIAPSGYEYFKKKYLDQYASQLSANSFKYQFITYQGVTALEYSFNQGELPTKAILFLKNRKSYLIQLGSRYNLMPSFIKLKNGFQLIN